MPGKGGRDIGELEPEQVRKIFIGGLDYATTEESLEAYFERWGDIVDLVVMKDPYTKRSRGFGFVTYSHSDMVDEAMNNRPHKIDGREVETKRAIPKEEIEHIPQQALDVKKLFVGGLKHLEKTDLEDHFMQFGTIVSCDIIMHRDTGVKRGFAFLEFDDTDAADKAILHQKHDVNGVRLFVKKAADWDEVRKSNSSSGFRSRGGFRGGRGGRDDYFDRRSSFRDDYDGGRRGGRGRGGGGGGFGRRDYDRDDMYDGGYRGGGGGRRGGFRDDDDWDDRPPRRDFGRRDDDWDDRPSRRFREDSMERGYGDGGYGGGGSGGGGRYSGGGGGGPMRSSFGSSSRSAPYETSYPLNRRGRY